MGVFAIIPLSSQDARRRAIGILALIGVGLAWWLFNRNNQLTPDSTYRELRGLGIALLDGSGYRQTFPIWGYPIVVAGIGFLSRSVIDIALPLLQLALCLVVSIALVWRWLGRWRLLYLLLWLLLMIPVVSYACLRLPDGLVMVLLLAVVLSLRNWVETRRPLWLVLGGLSVAVSVNMRSETLLLIVCSCLAALLVLGLRRTPAARLLVVHLAVLSVVAFLALIPWAVNSKAYSGTPLLTSTNGPGWFYVGLGQLPNNPWGLQGLDADAWAFVRSKGGHPFSLEGSRVLTPEIRRLVEEHPAAYIEKVGWNLRQAALGGVWTKIGYQTPDSTPGRTHLERIRSLLSLRVDGWAWATETVFYRTRMFRLVFLLLSALSLWTGVRALMRSSQRWQPAASALAQFCLFYTVFEFALVSLGYYQSRFMSPLYAVQLAVLANLFSLESAEGLLGAPARYVRALFTR